MRVCFLPTFWYLDLVHGSHSETRQSQFNPECRDKPSYPAERTAQLTKVGLVPKGAPFFSFLSTSVLFPEIITVALCRKLNILWTLCVVFKYLNI